MSDSLRPHESQHARPPCPSPTPGVYPNSCPLSRWCHPATSSSVVPFSSCPQSLPASESFPMSQLFAWGGQSIGVAALASFLPKNTQGWSLEWTGWISLQSKGLSLGYVYLFKLVLSFFLDICPGVKLLTHMVVLICSFLRNLHTVFHSGYTKLHSHQHFIRVPFSPYPHQHVICRSFLMIAILTDVSCYLIVVLTCISLMIIAVKHLFMFSC